MASVYAGPRRVRAAHARSWGQGDNQLAGRERTFHSPEATNDAGAAGRKGGAIHGACPASGVRDNRRKRRYFGRVGRRAKCEIGLATSPGKIGKGSAG